MRVIIVGGGIAGLLVALCLNKHEIECVVVERRAEGAQWATGVYLNPRVVGGVEALGLLDSLDSVGVRLRAVMFATDSGQSRDGDLCDPDSVRGHAWRGVHLERLYDLLMNAVIERLGRSAVLRGWQLVEAGQSGHGVFAYIASRTGDRLLRLDADVLVGADGVHSDVRRKVFPVEKAPRWTGVTAWTGVTRWPEFGTSYGFSGGSMIVADGLSTTCVMYPIGPVDHAGFRLTSWLVSARTGSVGDRPPITKGWGRYPDAREAFSRAVGVTVPFVAHRGLVMATDEVFFSAEFDQGAQWSRSHGRCVLVGDAANAFSPMGCGVADATGDAQSLAAHLAGSADPRDALERYQDDRLRMIRLDGLRQKHLMASSEGAVVGFEGENRGVLARAAGSGNG